MHLQLIGVEYLMYPSYHKLLLVNNKNFKSLSSF